MRTSLEVLVLMLREITEEHVEDIIRVEVFLLEVSVMLLLLVLLRVFTASSVVEGSLINISEAGVSLCDLLENFLRTGQLQLIRMISQREFLVGFFYVLLTRRTGYAQQIIIVLLV